MSAIVCTPVKTEIVTIENMQVEVLMYLNKSMKYEADVKVSFISLDMQWCKPSRGDKVVINKWNRLQLDPSTFQYYFKYGSDRIVLHEEVVEMVKFYNQEIVEKHLLGRESETITK